MQERHLCWLHYFFPWLTIAASCTSGEA